MLCDEINNDLFNESILYFIIELKFSVNVLKFEFMLIINNELAILLK